MLVEGKAWKLGKNINTDVIISARYLNTFDLTELGKHCLEDLNEEFIKKVKPGDIIVAEENFGCGSSREHAALAIKGAGISCVIAKSFARIFFRNAINVGLPILESSEAVDYISNGDKIKIDLSNGKIINLTNKKSFQAQPFPDFIKEIINQGGLIKCLKNKFKAQEGEKCIE